MERTRVVETTEKIGEKVLVAGWAAGIRDHGKIVFIDLRDRSGVVQCVGKDLEKVSVESVVEIVGTVKARPEKLINADIETGKIEIEIEEMKVLSRAGELPIPIDENVSDEASIQKRLDWRWIDLRRADNRKIFDVWTSLERGFREYFHDNGYVQVYSPSFMKSPSESGAEVFEVEYFDTKAYLAQSPQFYKQLAMAAGLEKVFMAGPVFRAEPSYTTRHMTEFTGWDFEISFIKDYRDIMDEEEKMIVSGFAQVNDDLEMDLEIPETPFPRIPFHEVKKMLEAEGIVSENEYDVSPEEERGLAKIVKDRHNHDFVFITDWPWQKRAFYHMRLEEDNSLTKGFDLLYKGIEVTTGAQREHRIEVLEEQAREKQMPIAELQYYFDFFRYGCPPHGGGGIGPGRIVMQILGLASVKEATFLPRDVKRLSP